MYHSLTFQHGNTRINTWDNWRLIPSSLPVIVQPTPVFKYVDIPGRDGSLDTTDYLIGRPTYSDRKGSIEFIVANTVGNTQFYGSAKDRAKSIGNWENRRTQIAAFLDGRKLKVFLEDDPQHYYYGRVFFKEWRSDAQFSKVVIEYQFDPYKYTRDGQKAGL